jgi:methylmalonyl-CoA mutase N-terminal domain/subunit
MAIQLIINREWDWRRTRTRTSFVIDELTELVEEAVLAEFERRRARRVLGRWKPATSAARSRKSRCTTRCSSTGRVPIVGVNTFATRTATPARPRRAAALDRGRKWGQLQRLADSMHRYAAAAPPRCSA